MTISAPTTAHPTTPDTVLAAIAALGPQADARAAEIAEARRLPDDLAAMLVDTGVFRLWAPTECGGMQAAPLDLFRAIELAGYHEGSLGWIVMVCGTTSRTAGQLRSDHARALFGDLRSVVGGFVGPTGTATVVPGGLRVTGRWPWGSGTPMCTAIAGTARIVDSVGQATTLADGTSAPFIYFDRSQVELADNWDTVGLRGSASGDFIVTDAFVPDGRWLPTLAAPATIDDPLYRFAPIGALAGGIAAVCLGLARRAVDEIYAMGAGKRPQGSSRSMAERPAVQADVARAEARVHAARGFLWQATDEAYADAANGYSSPTARRQLRLAASHAAAESATAIDACYVAAGGSSIWRGHPLQRVFQDMHVATQHAGVAAPTFEVLGRIGFGLDTDTTMI